MFKVHKNKKKQKNMDAFLSFKPFVQNGDLPIKNTVSSGISSEGAGKEDSWLNLKTKWLNLKTK